MDRNFRTNCKFVHRLNLQLLKTERHTRRSQMRKERGGSITTLESNKFHSLRKVRYPDKYGKSKNQSIQEMPKKAHYTDDSEVLIFFGSYRLGLPAMPYLVKVDFFLAPMEQNVRIHGNDSVFHVTKLSVNKSYAE